MPHYLIRSRGPGTGSTQCVEGIRRVLGSVLPMIGMRPVQRACGVAGRLPAEGTITPPVPVRPIAAGASHPAWRRGPASSEDKHHGREHPGCRGCPGPGPSARITVGSALPPVNISAHPRQAAPARSRMGPRWDDKATWRRPEMQTMPMPMAMREPQTFDQPAAEQHRRVHANHMPLQRPRGVAEGIGAGLHGQRTGGHQQIHIVAQAPAELATASQARSSQQTPELAALTHRQSRRQLGKCTKRVTIRKAAPARSG